MGSLPGRSAGGRRLDDEDDVVLVALAVDVVGEEEGVARALKI